MSKVLFFRGLGGKKNFKSCSERYRLVLLVKYNSPLQVVRLFFSKGSVPKLKKNQCENINPRPKVNCKHRNWDNKSTSCGQVSAVPMRSLSGSALSLRILIPWNSLINTSQTSSSIWVLSMLGELLKLIRSWDWQKHCPLGTAKTGWEVHVQTHPGVQRWQSKLASSSYRKDRHPSSER